MICMAMALPECAPPNYCLAYILCTKLSARSQLRNPARRNGWMDNALSHYWSMDSHYQELRMHVCHLIKSDALLPCRLDGFSGSKLSISQHHVLKQLVRLALMMMPSGFQPPSLLPLITLLRWWLMHTQGACQKQPKTMTATLTHQV